jgi:hypothetical protein
LLQDTAGVPRLVEAVYSHAVLWLTQKHRHKVDRQGLLEALLSNTRVSRLFCDAELIGRALEFTFFGWRISPRTALRKVSPDVAARVAAELADERDNLIRTGYLHLAKNTNTPSIVRPLLESATVIPPLLMQLWHFNDAAAQQPILQAALKFLDWDDVTAYSPEAFERQLTSFWKLAYSADYIWRCAPALPGQPPCLRLAYNVPSDPSAPFTLHSMLGCQFFPCCSDSPTCMQALSDYPLGCYPEEVQSFETGENLDELSLGMCVPLQHNHPGFDSLSISLTVDKRRFYAALEYKFTVGKTSIATHDIADKLVLALATYYQLRVALSEGRFCFVLPTFQVLPNNHTPMSIAIAAYEKLLDHLQLETLPFTVEQVAKSVLLLRRPHLEMLLTPTLSSRSQFRRAVDQPTLYAQQLARSTAYKQQRQAEAAALENSRVSKLERAEGAAAAAVAQLSVPDQSSKRPRI